MAGYKGKVRMDFGPLRPVTATIMPVERDGVNGMECRMDTLDFGRIMTEAFDDDAILDVMAASDARARVHPVVALRRTAKGLAYTVTGEKPEHGVLGDPIRAFCSSQKLYKALGFHGQVIEAGKRQARGYPPLLVIQGLADGVVVSSAIKFSLSTGEMRNLHALLESGLSPWVKITGFGDITCLRVDSRTEYRVYINSLQHFSMAESEDTDFGAVDPGEMAAKMREREMSFTNFRA